MNDWLVSISHENMGVVCCQRMFSLYLCAGVLKIHARQRSAAALIDRVFNAPKVCCPSMCHCDVKLMSTSKQRAGRVQSRLSVLRVLGETETEISPLQDKKQEVNNGQDAAGKRRRKSRVSFGNIQTAIFEKDSHWTNTPSPGNYPFRACLCA